ncbi:MULTISPECIES: sensor histidine kinase [unclassified Paenibacillus]|uniref:sensor histidine kinase n=1 Tax=unclassified Paenibacillus TaxID=185978 RepID=UPI000840AC94|nr:MULTISPECIES: ATP-binding protein [unclassified Paenibacillus]
MKLFIKDHLSIGILYLVTFFGLFLLYDWLDGFEVGGKVYFVFVSLVLLLIFLLYRYITRRKVYEQLSAIPTKPEDMLIHNPHSVLEEAYAQSMRANLQLYHSQMNHLKNRQQEYQTMLGHWVHQIKTPVSVISMLTQINEGNEDFAKVQASINKINYNLSQLLTYLRTEDFAADLKIEQVPLRNAVSEVINDLKDFFISGSVYPSVSIEGNLSVYTDRKWLKTMLYQVMNNAIKYSKPGKNVQIAAKIAESTVVLSITNEGGGIEPSDLNRVFDLFFTGENGRRFGESTGMGLYLVKRIADMLQHQYKLESMVDGATTFYFYFRNHD